MTSKKLSRCSWVRARADFRFPAGNLVEEEHGGRRSGLAAQARVDDLLTQDDLDFMQLPIGNCRSLHLWEHTHTLPRADSGGGAKRHLTDRGRPRRVGRVPQVAAVRHDDTVRVGALDRHRGRAAVARPPEIPLPLAAIVTRPEDRCRSSGHPMAMPLISTANTSSASSTTATTVWNLAGEVLRRLDVGGGHDFPHAQPTDS